MSTLPTTPKIGSNVKRRLFQTSDDLHREETTVDRNLLPNFNDSFPNWNLCKPLEPQMDHVLWKTSIGNNFSKGDGYKPQCELGHYDPIWYPHYEDRFPHPRQTPPSAAPCHKNPCHFQTLDRQIHGGETKGFRMVGHVPVPRNSCMFPGPMRCGRPPVRMPRYRPPGPPRPPGPVDNCGPAARLRWLVDFRLDNFWAQPLDPNPAASNSEPRMVNVGHDHSYEVLATKPDAKLIDEGKETRDAGAGDRRPIPWTIPPSVCRPGPPGHQGCRGGRRRSHLTYVSMIEKAISEKGPLTVAGIYDWVRSHFPYFSETDDKWKNSIRHNLSLNPQFQKGIRCENGGHVWHLVKPGEVFTPVSPPTPLVTPQKRSAAAPKRERGRGRPPGRGRGSSRGAQGNKEFCGRGKRVRLDETEREELQRALETIQCKEEEEDDDDEELRLLSTNAHRILFCPSPDRNREERVRVETVGQVLDRDSEAVLQAFPDLPWNDTLYF